MEYHHHPERQGSSHVLQSSVDHGSWHAHAGKAEQALQKLVKVLQHTASGLLQAEVPSVLLNNQDAP